MKESETQDQINTERLKLREKIHFFDEVHLFEDELGDNGSSSMSVKMVIIEMRWTLYGKGSRYGFLILLFFSY